MLGGKDEGGGRLHAGGQLQQGAGEESVPLVAGPFLLQRHGHAAAVAGQQQRALVGVGSPDPDERAVMAKIVERKDKGFSWYQIASHLLLRGVVSAKTGREWSESRCKRGYRAEIELRKREAAPARPAGEAPGE
jgi:hypothetical protein